MNESDDQELHFAGNGRLANNISGNLQSVGSAAELLTQNMNVFSAVSEEIYSAEALNIQNNLHHIQNNLFQLNDTLDNVVPSLNISGSFNNSISNSWQEQTTQVIRNVNSTIVSVNGTLNYLDNLTIGNFDYRDGNSGFVAVNGTINDLNDMDIWNHGYSDGNCAIPSDAQVIAWSDPIDAIGYVPEKYEYSPHDYVGGDIQFGPINNDGFQSSDAPSPIGFLELISDYSKFDWFNNFVDSFRSLLLSLKHALALVIGGIFTLALCYLYLKVFFPRLIGRGIEGYIPFQTWARPPPVTDSIEYLPCQIGN